MLQKTILIMKTEPTSNRGPQPRPWGINYRVEHDDGTVIVRKVASCNSIKDAKALAKEWSIYANNAPIMRQE